MTEQKKPIPPLIHFKRKVRKVGESLIITLPKEIVESLEINEGDFLNIYAEDNDTIKMKRTKK